MIIGHAVHIYDAYAIFLFCLHWENPSTSISDTLWIYIEMAHFDIVRQV